jgi:class 3 adenylate cyclase
MSARLESATKQYGVLLLLSEEVQSLLSPDFKELTRIVDKVVLKGFEQPINMYTVDIDLDSNL